jgi:flavin reductase (DIM6/NTAB) family NADH-FMN oxidoreductase RutF
MSLQNIPIERWQVKPHDLWDNQSLLLTSGDFLAGKYNCMTVGWGSFGTMWGRPFAMVVVRPQRYTYEFMEKFDSFTLTAFPKQYQSSLTLLGTKSGRNGNKIQEAGLTPTASTQINAPAFEEASLIIECKKVYWQDMNPDHFLANHIQKMYSRSDYHRIYFGDIQAVFGESNFME